MKIVRLGTENLRKYNPRRLPEQLMSLFDGYIPRDQLFGVSQPSNSTYVGRKSTEKTIIKARNGEMSKPAWRTVWTTVERERKKKERHSQKKIQKKTKKIIKFEFWRPRNTNLCSIPLLNVFLLNPMSSSCHPSIFRHFTFQVFCDYLVLRSLPRA